MMRIFSIMALCVIATFTRANDDTRSFIADAKLNEAKQLQNYTQFAIEAKQHESSVTAPYLAEAKLDQTKSDQILNDHQPSDSDIKKYSPAILFVSFSMSDESIASYLRNAKKIHASVVIRGLINNSFKDTFLKMTYIVKQAGGGGVELNPSVFKKFSISRVPAVVVLPSNINVSSLNTPFKKTDFDVVYGDIPLYDALKTVRDHGVVSRQKADELLSLLKDSFHA